MSEWFVDDELCWIAECEQCYVPMVVWKRHHPAPPEEVKVVLIDRLGEVVRAAYTFDEFYVDDNMRTIPDHYHAHARPRGGFYGHGMRKP